jgi:hypothetical protein
VLAEIDQPSADTLRPGTAFNALTKPPQGLLHLLTTHGVLPPKSDAHTACRPTGARRVPHAAVADMLRGVYGAISKRAHWLTTPRLLYQFSGCCYVHSLLQLLVVLAWFPPRRAGICSRVALSQLASARLWQPAATPPNWWTRLA